MSLEAEFTEQLLSSDGDDDDRFEAWVLESCEPPEDWEDMNPGSDWEPSDMGDPPHPDELPEYLLYEPRRRAHSPESWGSQEFVHPDEWQTLQECQPPEDWEVAPASPELTPEDFDQPGEWDLSDDLELMRDWVHYGVGMRELSVSKSQLTRTKLFDVQTFAYTPGCRLTAGDWTPEWIAWISKLFSHKVRRANIGTMFRELLGPPDILLIIQRETTHRWVPASERRGYYYKKNPETGIVDDQTLVSPQKVHLDHYWRQEAYETQCRKFSCRGRPLVADILSCFDGISMSERVRRAIALRVEFGIPTRVPVSQDADGKILTLGYVFGNTTEVDVSSFFKRLKFHRARIPLSFEDDGIPRPHPGMSDDELIEHWLS
ncbi:hypothetical protein MD484_g7880, partial [Candolleomyces efflorescens]